jgi:hypothetical protein
MEYGTDLGRVRDILASGSNGGAYTVTLPTGSDLSKFYIVYFALDRTTNELWATGNANIPSMVPGIPIGFSNLKAGTNGMYTLYNTQGGHDYIGSALVFNSYQHKLSSTQGNLAGAISPISRYSTEASLASLVDGTSNTINQTLYYWPNAVTTDPSEQVGMQVATITTTVTPIPSAFFMMGSGLIGLLGFKRRKL